MRVIAAVIEIGRWLWRSYRAVTAYMRDLKADRVSIRPEWYRRNNSNYPGWR